MKDLTVQSESSQSIGTIPDEALSHSADFVQSRPSTVDATIEVLRGQFYRCKFRQIVETLSGFDTGSLDYAQAVMKANALFELHQVPEARATLAALTPSDQFNEECLYAIARLSYFDGDYEGARTSFQKVVDQSESDRHKFRGLLGLANVLYTEGSFDKLPAIIERLCEFEPIKRDDDRISLTIFLGNYYLASGSSTELAKKYFTQALSTAAARNWNYFVLRSLYGLASVADKAAVPLEVQSTLNILCAFVDEEESVYFSYLVNERFKNNSFSINTPIEFDTENKRILVKDRWLPFHDKPLLYRFLELLHERRQFVPKEVIAVELWPNEDYKPRSHDPRIFDIAKRARAMIEAYENQPVVLLSGRLGYKLAST